MVCLLKSLTHLVEQTYKYLYRACTLNELPHEPGASVHYLLNSRSRRSISSTFINLPSKLRYIFSERFSSPLWTETTCTSLQKWHNKEDNFDILQKY